LSKALTPYQISSRGCAVWLLRDHFLCFSNAELRNKQNSAFLGVLPKWSIRRCSKRNFV